MVLGMNRSGALITGTVVFMGFALLAIAFTRTEKPSDININELDFVYGVNTTQLLDGDSTYYDKLHETRCSLGKSLGTFYSSIQKGSENSISQYLGGCE